MLSVLSTIKIFKKSKTTEPTTENRSAPAPLGALSHGLPAVPVLQTGKARPTEVQGLDPD